MIKRIIKKGGKKISEKITKKKTIQTTLSDINLDQYMNEPLDLKYEKKEKLHITHWNINGLRAVIRKESLKNYLNGKDFDIVCLSEIKIDKLALRKEKINENDLWYKKYNQYYHFSTFKKGYSGVSIFSKLKPVNKFFGMNEEKFDKEGRVITLEYKKFYLVNVYVPNSKSKLERLKERVEEFDLKFRNFITELKKKKTVIVLGDMNVAHKEIDLKDPKRNKRSNGFTIEERNSFDLYMENGFVDRWRDLYPKKIQYSWWSYLSRKPRSTGNGWRIDYCLIDEEAKHAIKDVVIREDIYGSDHCPVEIHLDLELLVEKKEEFDDKEKTDGEKNEKDKDLNNKKDENKDKGVIKKNIEEEEEKNKVIASENEEIIKNSKEKLSKEIKNIIKEIQKDKS